MAGKFYLMTEQLRSGVCRECFCFAGESIVDDKPFPICKSTIHPTTNTCTKTPPERISPASQKSRPTEPSTKKKKSPEKIMVSIGNGKFVEQAHFNDYLKLLKKEKQERV